MTDYKQKQPTGARNLQLPVGRFRHTFAFQVQPATVKYAGTHFRIARQMHSSSDLLLPKSLYA
jgi:hypothetical protein